MIDVVDRATRSRMMAGIRGKNTKPELLIRRGLHARGFRYRLHSGSICGKPDMVLRRYRAAIFVHGCFWHGHGCHLFRMPATRTEFWQAKIARNRERDEEVRVALRESGWRQLVVWECALKGRTRIDFESLMDRVCAWVTGGDPEGQMEGEACP